METPLSLLRSRVSAVSVAVALGLTLLSSTANATEPGSAEMPIGQETAPSDSGEPSLATLRTAASAHLDASEQAKVDGMSEETLAQLLNAPTETKHSAEEEAIVSAFNKAAFDSSLKYQSGVIELGDGLAKLHLSNQFRYLDPNESKRLLVDAWGNPPGGETLGMIIPVGTSPLHDKKGWGVVVSYSEEGHVDDDDAEDLDYDELLEEMKADTAESSKERVKQGFGAISLVGWAEPPHYDQETHRLYWAKELAFADATEHTLNYGIRILGRKGVLELNAVAGLSQLQAVRQDMKQVLPLAEFNSGKTYADFNPDLDQVAAYGIGGLIAGKVLAKVGLLAGLFKLLIVFKKVLIFGLLGAGALVAKWFKGKNQS